MRKSFLKHASLILSQAFLGSQKWSPKSITGVKTAACCEQDQQRSSQKSTRKRGRSEFQAFGREAPLLLGFVRAAGPTAPRARTAVADGIVGLVECKNA